MCLCVCVRVGWGGVDGGLITLGYATPSISYFWVQLHPLSPVMSTDPKYIVRMEWFGPEYGCVNVAQACSSQCQVHL